MPVKSSVPGCSASRQDRPMQHGVLGAGLHPPWRPKPVGEGGTALSSRQHAQPVSTTAVHVHLRVSVLGSGVDGLRLWRSATPCTRLALRACTVSSLEGSMGRRHSAQRTRERWSLSCSPATSPYGQCRGCACHPARCGPCTIWHFPTLSPGACSLGSAGSPMRHTG